jgi:hypothetical protein
MFALQSFLPLSLTHYLIVVVRQFLAREIQLDQRR